MGVTKTTTKAGSIRFRARAWDYSKKRLVSLGQYPSKAAASRAVAEYQETSAEVREIEETPRAELKPIVAADKTPDTKLVLNDDWNQKVIADRKPVVSAHSQGMYDDEQLPRFMRPKQPSFWQRVKWYLGW